MNDGIKDKYCQAIRDILAAHPRVERAVLFGSRAIGTFAPESDIDLALFGETLTLTDQAELAAAIDNLTVPQQADLLLFGSVTNDVLRKHIEEHGVEWFARRVSGGLSMGAE